MSIEDLLVWPDKTPPIEHMRVQICVLQALIDLYEVAQSDASKEQRRAAAVLQATSLLREMAGQLGLADGLAHEVNELACLVEYLAL